MVCFGNWEDSNRYIKEELYGGRGIKDEGNGARKGPAKSSGVSTNIWLWWEWGYKQGELHGIPEEEQASQGGARGGRPGRLDGTRREGGMCLGRQLPAHGCGGNTEWAGQGV